MELKNYKKRNEFRFFMQFHIGHIFPMSGPLSRRHEHAATAMKEFVPMVKFHSQILPSQLDTQSDTTEQSISGWTIPG
jgi:hypothetical protein